MVFDAGAIKGKIQLDATEWKKPVEQVKTDVKELVAEVKKAEQQMQAVAPAASALQKQAAEVKKAAADVSTLAPTVAELKKNFNIQDTSGLKKAIGELEQLKVVCKDDAVALKQVNEQLEVMKNKLTPATQPIRTMRQDIKENTAALVGFGLALAGTGAAILAMGQKMVKLSSNAAETENLFAVSMGNMRKEAETWVNEFSAAMGINSTEVKNYSGVLKVMLESMGQTEQGALSMSQVLTKLAYDISSFRNISPEEAFVKLRAGIVGETEPLRQLGITVDETTTKNWALTNGLIKQGQEMTQAQKVTARYNVILEQTSKDQGDLERTIDSYANVTRRAEAVTAELAATLGTSLKDAQTEVLSLYVDLVSETNQVAKNHEVLTAGVVGSVEGFGALASIVGSLVLLLPGLQVAASAAGTTLAAVAGVTLGWVAVIALAIGGVAALITASKQSEKALEDLKTTTTDNYVELAKLEREYITAKEESERLGHGTDRLKESTSNLQAAYTGLGITVGHTAVEFGHLTESMARQQSVQLQGQIDALKKQAADAKAFADRIKQEATFGTDPRQQAAFQREFNLMRTAETSIKELEAKLGGLSEFLKGQDDEIDKIMLKPVDVLQNRVKQLQDQIKEFEDAGRTAGDVYKGLVVELDITEKALKQKKLGPDPKEDNLLKKAIGERNSELREQLAILQRIKAERTDIEPTEMKRLDEAIKNVRIELGELEKDKKKVKIDPIEMKDFFTPGTDLEKQMEFIKGQIDLFPKGSYEARMYADALQKLNEQMTGIKSAPKLDDVITSESKMRENLKTLEDLRATVKEGSKDFKALNDEIKKVKIGLGEFTPGVSELKEEFHIITTQELQATIAKLEQLQTAFSGDAVAIKQVNELLKETREKLSDLEDPLKKAGIDTTAVLRKQLDDLEKLKPLAAGDAVATHEIEQRTESIKKSLLEAQRATDAMLDFSMSAVENATGAMSDSFKELFGDAIRGELKGVESYFNDFCGKILDSFVELLAEMAAKKLASGLLDGLTGSGGSSGGGGGINWLGLAATGIGAFFGGPAGAAAGSTAGAALGSSTGSGAPVQGFGFSRAASFAPEGGSGNLEMQSAADVKASRGANPTQSLKDRVVIVNQITPEAVAAAMAAKAGENVIVNTINRNALNNGKARKAFQN